MFRGRGPARIGVGPDPSCGKSAISFIERVNCGFPASAISGHPDARGRRDDQHVPVAETYAVLWRTQGRPVHAGQLELLAGGFQLEGADRAGARALEIVDADEIVAVRIGRVADDRVDGRSTLVVERSTGDRLLIASATGLGRTHELADAVSRLAGPR
jgi:hypothetical protein